MITINIPEREYFNEKTNEFIKFNGATIALEHSLVSIAKWESKYHKAFLNDKEQKTNEELIDYIKFMTITQNVDDMAYDSLTIENFQEINAYIDNPMTATTISDTRKGPKPRSSQFITNELIYSWMVAYQIPFECQKWHLNRLLTLINVCRVNNESGNTNNKMSKSEILSRNKALNAARKKQLNTRG